MALGNNFVSIDFIFNKKTKSVLEVAVGNVVSVGVKNSNFYGHADSTLGEIFP